MSSLKANFPYTERPMNLPDIPMLSMLRERMSWLNARQDLLSQNVANADTPGFTARDLKPVAFQDLLDKANGAGGANALMTTDPRHIASPSEGDAQFNDFESPDISANPSGNSVSLEI